MLTPVAEGRSNLEIERALHVSAATVKTHVSGVRSKLGLRDRAQAVIQSYEHGIAEPGSRA